MLNFEDDSMVQSGGRIIGADAGIGGRIAWIAEGATFRNACYQGCGVCC